MHILALDHSALVMAILCLTFVVAAQLLAKPVCFLILWVADAAHGACAALFEGLNDESAMIELAAVVATGVFSSFRLWPVAKEAADRGFIQVGWSPFRTQVR
jgi:hypothetical protein